MVMKDTSSTMEKAYQLLIDGQWVSKLNQCRITLSELEHYFDLIHILLLTNFDNNSLEASSQARKDKK